MDCFAGDRGEGGSCVWQNVTVALWRETGGGRGKKPSSEAVAITHVRNREDV